MLTVFIPTYSLTMAARPAAAER